MLYMLFWTDRSVAQFGRALRSGRRGRRFKSCRFVESGALKHKGFSALFIFRRRWWIHLFTNFLRISSLWNIFHTSSYIISYCFEHSRKLEPYHSIEFHKVKACGAVSAKDNNLFPGVCGRLNTWIKTCLL